MPVVSGDGVAAEGEGEEKEGARREGEKRRRRDSGKCTDMQKL